MLKNYDPDSNIDDLTNSEIYAAICYLEPQLTSDEQRHAEDQDDNSRDIDNGVVICVGLYVAMVICLVFLWFYRL